MKNIINLILLISIALGTIMISCNKNTELQNEAETQEQTNLKDTPGEANGTLSITCTGTCDNGESCRIGTVGGSGIWKCDCEGCKLVIHIPDGTKMSEKEFMKELSNRDLFLNQLNAFVMKKFDTRDYGIERIKYTSLDKENYYISYEIITDDGQTESVIYAVKSDSSDAAPVTYEIDCTGSCDDPSEICAEQFNLNTGIASCTCEGDNCILNVKIID